MELTPPRNWGGNLRNWQLEMARSQWGMDLAWLSRLRALPHHLDELRSVAGQFQWRLIRRHVRLATTIPSKATPALTNEGTGAETGALATASKGLSTPDEAKRSMSSGSAVTAASGAIADSSTPFSNKTCGAPDAVPTTITVARPKPSTALHCADMFLSSLL